MLLEKHQKRNLQIEIRLSREPPFFRVYYTLGDERLFVPVSLCRGSEESGTAHCGHHLRLVLLRQIDIGSQELSCRVFPQLPKSSDVECCLRKDAIQR